MPLRDKVSPFAILVGLFVIRIRMSRISSSILGDPSRAGVPNQHPVQFIVLCEQDVDVEFDDGPWKGDGTILLIKGSNCFIADRDESRQIINPRQVTVPEALQWWVEMARRSQGSRYQPYRLAILAARMIEEAQEA